jgi:hypothetical protein
MVGHELHCVWDTRGIPEDRARKGAITCCDECKRQYASKLDPVLMEHTAVYGALGTQ